MMMRMMMAVVVVVVDVKEGRKKDRGWCLRMGVRGYSRREGRMALRRWKGGGIRVYGVRWVDDERDELERPSADSSPRKYGYGERGAPFRHNHSVGLVNETDRGK